MIKTCLDNLDPTNKIGDEIWKKDELQIIELMEKNKD
jgi:hypothetical protein